MTNWSILILIATIVVILLRLTTSLVVVRKLVTLQNSKTQT